ncbi:MAG TPA: preprotein translocase subunit YajC [Thiothrix sp.]|nr:preprotein translocase subunit YajC [Thiothrix sp.]
MGLFIADAYAEGAAPGGGDPIQLVIMVAVFFAIMYFMIIRPQQKRAKEHESLLGGMSKGDEVVTTGGILGKVVNIGENFIEMKVSEGTTLKIQKHAIANVMPKGTMKSL